MDLFKFSFEKINDCKPCRILCSLLKRKTSLWDLLADSDDPNAKEKKNTEKENPPYNYLFYEHNGYACNGM